MSSIRPCERIPAQFTTAFSVPMLGSMIDTGFSAFFGRDIEVMHVHALTDIRGGSAIIRRVDADVAREYLEAVSYQA